MDKEIYKNIQMMIAKETDTGTGRDHCLVMKFVIIAVSMS